MSDKLCFVYIVPTSVIMSVFEWLRSEFIFHFVLCPPPPTKWFMPQTFHFHFNIPERFLFWRQKMLSICSKVEKYFSGSEWRIYEAVIALMFLDRGLRSYYWFPNNHNQIRDTSRNIMHTSLWGNAQKKKHFIYLKHDCHCQPLTPYSKDKLHKKLFFLWFYLHFNNARFPSGC